MKPYHYPTYSTHWLLHGLSALVSLVLVSLTLLASLFSSVLLILLSTVLWAFSFQVTHFSTSPTVNLTYLWSPYQCYCISWSKLTLFCQMSPLQHRKEFLWCLMWSISTGSSVLALGFSWSFDLNLNLFYIFCSANADCTVASNHFGFSLMTFMYRKS